MHILRKKSTVVCKSFYRKHKFEEWAYMNILLDEKIDTEALKISQHIRQSKARMQGEV